MLRAGTGRVDVSPRDSTFLWGYPHVERMSTGIHDPLYATALCLDDGTNQTIAVAVDILYVSSEIVAECRQRISERVSVPPEHVMITATHTHSGPVTCRILAMSGDPVLPAPDPAYVELLTQGIVDAACQAAQDLEAAEVAITGAAVDGVGCNRLSPDAVRDPEAGLVAVRRSENGSMVACQLFYSMHPTVMHEDSTLVSSDFPAFARQRIEESFPGVRVLYHNGPCGNLSPRYHAKSQTFDEAERLGRRLGGFVAEAIEGLSDRAFLDDISVGGAQSAAQLVPREFPSVKTAMAGLREALENYERLKQDGAEHGPLRTAECTTFGAEELVTMATAQMLGKLAEVQDAHASAEVQVLRLGSAFLVGLTGELFVEYALEIKARAPGRTFLASMANGHLQGYITTPEAVGYEANLSMFKPESGSILVEVVLELIKEIGT